MAKQKHYVVWRGRRTGIFDSWAACERQVSGFVGAQYKAFDRREEAEGAFAAGYRAFAGRSQSSGRWRTAARKPVLPSVCVDAACDGSPGRLEYRGVKTDTGEQIFRDGPYQEGTNNVGEFLAIVEALRWLSHQHLDWPVYSDSDNALGWVRAKKCNTKLRRTAANDRLFELIRREELLLRRGELVAVAGGPSKLLKWDTRAWGENPADFGRK